jgi:aspartyl aminopeptidase
MKADKKNIWESYDTEQLAELEALNREYMDFLDQGKTERECVDEVVGMLHAAGYRELEELLKRKAAGEAVSLVPGDKVYSVWMNKTLVAFALGSKPLAEGMNILGAHIDSPRLDVKQNPLYEEGGFAYLDTHYYGGVKKYQWVTLPLAIHGVVVLKDGTTVEMNIGENADDPVFFVSDLLIHLAGEQMDKKASKVIEGEALDIIVGSKPLLLGKGEVKEVSCEDECAKKCECIVKSEEVRIEGVEDSLNAIDAEKQDGCDQDEPSKKGKDAIKKGILHILKEEYGFEEEDFASAELEVVPAGAAREAGFDRSMILAYGQDDRVCAYTSVKALLDIGDVEKTVCCILSDKEEVGSIGATGMQSRFFENTVAEMMELLGVFKELELRRCLAHSKMLSSDVNAAYDPSYDSCFDKRNASYLGGGMVFSKFTGARGKSGSNDANAEYMAQIRRILDDNKVRYQTAELGKVDIGGGGTIAYILAGYGMEVIDSGVAVLNMHAPWEATGKADIYETYRGYKAFAKNA